MKDDVSGLGSIIVVIGTDAPLLPHQLERLARRAALGLARTGSIASNGSGDIFIAFSTANEDVDQATAGVAVEMVSNEDINPLFNATVQAVEEAIVNSLVAGRTMTGTQGHTVTAIDHQELQEVLKRYGRLNQD